MSDIPRKDAPAQRISGHKGQYRHPSSPKEDRFPNLRRIGLRLGIDPAKLTQALARASAALDEMEKNER